MILVRHPETSSPTTETTNTPPNAHGKVQAIKVAGFFKNKSVKKLYVSPTKRAHYQADAISKATGVSAEEDDRLKPWDVRAPSEQEYNTKLDHYAKNPDTKPDTTDETFNQFASRVAAFHQEHADEPDTVAVTHSKNIMVHKAIAVSPDEKSFRSRVGSADRNKVKDIRISSIGDKSFKPELVLKNSASEERQDA